MGPTKLLKRLVGPPRFELGTSCTPSKRASQAAPRPETSIVHVIPRPSHNSFSRGDRIRMRYVMHDQREPSIGRIFRIVRLPQALIGEASDLCHLLCYKAVLLHQSPRRIAALG
jgi:hypothetical protein